MLHDHICATHASPMYGITYETITLNKPNEGNHVAVNFPSKSLYIKQFIKIEQKVVDAAKRTDTRGVGILHYEVNSISTTQ